MSDIDFMNVDKSYGDTRLVINKVNLRVEPGEFCVFVGPSGCGKSTLLRMVAGLEDITGGEIHIAGNLVNDRLMDVTKIVEKPAPEVAPSRWGVAGRYILTPGVFHEIATQPRGVGGEIQLTDGIAALLRREKVFAYRYEGKRYDCGSKEGFLEANVELALAHAELGPGFRAFLKNLSL